VSLRTKLLALLLAFGAVPLALAIALGYGSSRLAITRQADRALRELAQAQAVHLGAELDRQRLILRTIAGQLPAGARLAAASEATLSRLLVQSLPEGGVFDGLRIVTRGGRILAAVALRNTAPHWPPAAPAADWSERSAAVHRDGWRALAYLVAVPAGGPQAAAWLEGHVRAEDFRRVFAIPEHIMDQAEAAVLQRGAGVIATGHEHAEPDLRALTDVPALDSAIVVRAAIGRNPSLVAVAPVAGTDWVYAVALPLDVALAPLTRARNTAILGATALVVLIVLTAAVAARTVSTPLSELMAAAGSFGRGGAHRPIPPRSRDEVGQLVQSFNRMAADLVASRGEVEQLHQRELERAQQLATVGELASGVAHEIRNPLTGVLGALDIALRKLAADDASRPFLSEAQEQLRRIEAATTQLLRYARPPAMREMPVDANQLVERAVNVLAAQARTAQVDLRTERAAGPTVVRVDPELMVQVLVNLMLNGIEAMPSGGTLTVSVTSAAREARIGVRDTGPGIPPERRAEIFRPFFTTKHKGTGLGLSISQQIVTRHGGALRLEDTPGGGASFVVTLPLADGSGGGP
jgi:signal transduction histidine kinase